MDIYIKKSFHCIYCKYSAFTCNTSSKDDSINPNEMKANHNIKLDIYVNRFYTNIEKQKDAVSEYLYERLGRNSITTYMMKFGLSHIFYYLKIYPFKGGKYGIMNFPSSSNTSSAGRLLYLRLKRT